MLKIKGVLIAKSPIHHGGDEKTGAETLLRRIKIYSDGKFREIPYIDGNAIRGVVRRLIFSDLLEKLDYELTNTKLYHSLFAGGLLETVSAKDSGILDLEMRKKVRKYLPPLSVFGTSFGNQVLAGKLIVGKMLPICTEMKDMIPDVGIVPDHSFYDFLDFTYGTRKDELREKREEGEQAMQMLYSYEVFIPGTPFYHHFALENFNEIEKAVLGRVIELWKQSPFIGGKKAIGNGELNIHYETEISSKPYLDFIEKNKDIMRNLLEELEGV